MNNTDSMVVKIDGIKYAISDVQFLDDGQVSANVVTDHPMDEEDNKRVSEFIESVLKHFVEGSTNGNIRRELNS